MTATDLRVLSTVAYALEGHGATTPFLRRAEDVVKQLAAEGLAIRSTAGREDLAARLREAFDKALRAENLSCYFDGGYKTREAAEEAATAALALIEEIGRT
ncbi:hypothetical protein [Amycolatopsis sp. PS_44_ISF1]|uniref:hypothetical protein n=1 Tax=Amycolatopsis sp. PS_44_ISF1 TaxID=2974917 RepID=UPI0028DFC2EF|nr:hypothetical protein [Amycolatopsis sp. PS_44_ISF1]MDT8915800.1 hypothetical protein [Amycolatopsis sp. PS_44_ISF1]MDT8916267.1 hypothetical protein [Amycolatopsis sp. PS_44_ISF1]